MDRRVALGAVAVAAVAVFAGGAWLYQSQQPQAPAAAAWETAGFVREHSPVIGNPSAPVTIIEFFDPACEACRAFFPYVKDILAKHGDDVRLVLRYAPFHGEPSVAAIGVLEAARKQDKLEPVLQLVMDRQPKWARHGGPALDTLYQIAEEAGIDVAAAKASASDPALASLLEQELADIKTHAVEGTPTFFVNGRPLLSFSPEGLALLVADEIAQTANRS